jgi:Fe(3+) dicitrate transport protein
LNSSSSFYPEVFMFLPVVTLPCVRRRLYLAMALASLFPTGLLAASEPSAAAITTVTVVGEGEAQAKIAGATTVISAQQIEDARATTVNEVLRKAPGLFPREEEGFGLRPNIGIRGLNPTRSSKVLLLEDGLPLAYSPYGDNASYYHPTLERFSGLEVLKGSGQIAFGPHTVGGVVNYLTPAPPASSKGRVRVTRGTQAYEQTYAEWGNTFNSGDFASGLLLQAVQKSGDGARENMDFDLNDYNIKWVQQLGQSHAVTLKATRYEEDSNVPYSGLTLAEYTANPRANPFTNDTFQASREGQSLVHAWNLLDQLRITTALYHTEFHRDWWRQSSNSSQRPNDSSDPTCGGMARLHTQCGNEGRLRDYAVDGVEPRLTWEHAWGETLLGLRYQEEQQDRLQINADTPRGRTPGTSPNGGLKEDNARDVKAVSGFIEQRFVWGDWLLTPGVRREDINYYRANRLNNTKGRSNLQETLAGVGLAYRWDDALQIFAGVHEGFSPPRVEDVISNSNGASVDLAAEKSLNSELGLRYNVPDRWRVEAALFQMDFDNQIVPASVAGGTGAALTSAGETLHRGLELLAHYQWNNDAAQSSLRPFTQVSYTWVQEARYDGLRKSAANSAQSVSGNRLPYAPEHNLSWVLGLRVAQDLRAQVEWLYVDDMYADDANTQAASANGQVGLLEAYHLYNLSLNYAFSPALTVFVAGKNLGDDTFLVDRSRGMIPGMGRSWQTGVELKF